VCPRRYGTANVWRSRGVERPRSFAPLSAAQCARFLIFALERPLSVALMSHGLASSLCNSLQRTSQLRRTAARSLARQIAERPILLVPGERIELPTNGLQNRCSTAELTRLANAFRCLRFGAKLFAPILLHYAVPTVAGGSNSTTTQREPQCGQRRWLWRRDSGKPRPRVHANISISSWHAGYRSGWISSSGHECLATCLDRHKNKVRTLCRATGRTPRTPGILRSGAFCINLASQIGDSRPLRARVALSQAD
jgi:hypothetical protein